MIRKLRFKILPLLALLALGLTAGGCSDDANPLAPQDGAKEAANALEAEAETLNDIYDTAVAADFSTLVAAVDAAGLEGALRGDGPLTVFAPTEDAFAALPEGFVEQLLAPRNEEKLVELLFYHVVAGEITSDDVRWWQFERSLEGQYLWIRKVWGGGVKVNGSNVVLADVMASNGVIHAIDKVLVPRGFELVPEEVTPTLNIVETADAAGVFETLLAAAGAADLAGTLANDGPLTVFAPTDDAFAMLPSDLVGALLLPENKSALQDLLKYHVLSGQVLSSDLDYYQRVTTLNGDDVRVVKWFGNVWVNWSRVTAADVLATNGVIHVINRVLVPRDFRLDTGNAVYTGEGLDNLINRTSREELPPTEFDLRYLQSER